MPLEKSKANFSIKNEKDILYRFLENCFRLYFKYFHSLEVKGELDPNLEAPFIVAANHASYFDPVILGVVTGKKICWLAWYKFFDIPVIGFLMRWGNAIPVDSTGSRRSYQASIQVLNSGGIFGIFPEGALTLDGEIHKGKTGIARIACKTDVPILPVTIFGGFRIYPKGGLPRPGKLIVTLHPPIFIDKERRNDKFYYQELTDNLMGIIEKGQSFPRRLQKRLDYRISRKAPPLRIYEVVPLLAPLMGAWFLYLSRYRVALHVQKPIILGAGLGIFYCIYLILDYFFLEQNYKTRAVRNFFPFFYMLFTIPFLEKVVRILNPDLVESTGVGFVFYFFSYLFYALGIIYGLAGSFLLSMENYYHFQKYIRGFCLATSIPFCCMLLPIFSPTIATYNIPFLLQPFAVLSIFAYSMIFDFFYRVELFPFSMIFFIGYFCITAFLGLGPALWNGIAALFLSGLFLIYISIFRFSAHDGKKI
ncbi:lysophospholipid acyltransferase family protein [Candidatus Riflebacteria bacterium]